MMQIPKNLPSIFEYLDYRHYLADYFGARRVADSRFSVRAFAIRLGVTRSNSNFFYKVIAGKRNLSMDLRFKVAKALKLGVTETNYFHLLVQFNQSKDMESRGHFYSELAKFRKSKARIIKKEGFEYYSKWTYSIVRAFFGIEQREKNPAGIGRRIFPPLTPKDVDEAIQLLLQLDLVTKTANGFSIKDPHIATERENKDFVGKLRILEMMRLAQEVFNNVPPPDRDYNTMTIYISKQGYQSVKEKIRSFREELKSMVDSDKGEDRIYTLNMQLFPNNVLPEWNPGTALPKG